MDGIKKRVLALIVALLVVGLAFLYIGWGDELASFAKRLGIDLPISHFGDTAARELTPGELELHFIDIGQGDAILLRTLDAAILVDTGTNDSEAYLRRYLKAVGVDFIDLLILTHPHEDHIGGADMLISRGFLSGDNVTGSVFANTLESANINFDKMKRAADRLGVPVSVPLPGSEYTLGGMKLTFLAPSPEFDTEANDGSLVVRVDFGETSILLTGDAEAPSEAAMLASYPDLLDCDILKVAHHGSSSSSSPEFLSAVTPELAVIICGIDNEYGHPHRETLEGLEAIGAKTLVADEAPVIFVVDAEGVEQLAA